MRLAKIIIAALIIILVMILFKYKIVYKVTISGEEIGYISNKNEFEKLLNDEILNPNKDNIAYVDIEEEPKYELAIASKKEETNEQEIFDKVEQMAVTTYKVYAIAVNNENATYVNTKTEAEEVVAKLKEQYESKTDEIDITLNEIYTQEIEQTIQVASAVSLTEEKVEEEVEKQLSTLDGVYFSVKPVSGNITSRFGANESIRDHTHKGIDIAASNGTTIVAAADGKITYSGWMSGYGNLIIITHENGIQTYYGHCSKLYVSEGKEVSAGDKIAAVGSTGYSTGNHLHFEIRKNGTQINPQTYLYN